MFSFAGTNGIFKFNSNLISFCLLKSKVCNDFSTRFSIFWLSADFERQEYVLVMRFVLKFLWGFLKKLDFS